MAHELALLSFLEKIKDQSLSVPVICFSGDGAYPLLFFARMIEQCKKISTQAVQSVDMSAHTKPQLLGQFETSFLGATTTYWLKDISALSSREQSAWREYCAQYVGPNTLWFFNPQDTVSHEYALTVMLPTLIDSRLFVSLAQWFGVSITSTHKRFISSLFAHQSAGITLETACLMIEYMQVIGSDHELFFNEVVHSMIPSDASLFALSSAFMAKKHTQFYPQWQKLASVYSEQFWCSFFSDLLWRGAEYVRLARKNDMIGARKIAYRLPFSFIKSDWQKHTSQELATAHAFIFDADFRFKNSGGYAAFDLFFSSFFLGTFV